MSDLHAQESGTDDLQLGHQAGEPRLTPEDFDVALRRMKRELALVGLRRSLRDASLGAAQIISIVRQIVTIQAEEDGDTSPPTRLRVNEILQVLSN